jgi:hypothetical protein
MLQLRRRLVDVFGVAMVAGHAAAAQQSLVIKPLVERKISKLPDAELFWRIENFDTEEKAKSAAGPTALVANRNANR